MDAMTLVMQILPLITVVSIFGAVLALFSYFIDFCLWKGNIFGFWLPFLAKMICKKFFRVKFDNISKITNKDQREQTFIDTVGDHGLFKVLGGCAICLNIWFGFVSIPFVFIPLEIPIYYAIVYLMMSSFILRKIMKVD